MRRFANSMASRQQIREGGQVVFRPGFPVPIHGCRSMTGKADDSQDQQQDNRPGQGDQEGLAASQAIAEEKHGEPSLEETLLLELRSALTLGVASFVEGRETRPTGSRPP